MYHGNDEMIAQCTSLISQETSPEQRFKKLRACLHGAGGLQIGEVTFGGSPHLSCKCDRIKMTDYMDRRVTQPKGVTSLTWGPPPPCEQALNVTIKIKYTTIFHGLHSDKLHKWRQNAQGNPSPGTRGPTWFLNILTSFLWSVEEYIYHGKLFSVWKKYTWLFFSLLRCWLWI